MAWPRKDDDDAGEGDRRDGESTPEEKQKQERELASRRNIPTHKNHV